MRLTRAVRSGNLPADSAGTLYDVGAELVRAAVTGGKYATPALYTTADVTITGRDRVVIDGAGSVLTASAGATAHILCIEDCVEVVLMNLHIDGAKADQTSPVDGLVLRNVAYLTMQSVRVRNCSGNGYVLENFDAGGAGYASVFGDEENLSDIFAIENDLNGFLVRPGTDGTNTSVQTPGDFLVRGLHATFNGLAGVRQEGGYFSRYAGVNLLSNGTDGAQFISAVGLQLDGFARANGRHGVSLDGGKRHKLSNLAAHYNNRTSDGMLTTDPGYVFGCGVYADGCDDLSLLDVECSDVDFGSATHRHYRPAVLTNCANARIVASLFEAGDAGTGGTGIVGAGVDVTGSTYRASCNTGLPDA